ncbi:MAG TPA: class I SAM-dependent methyltransferase [Ktedonobacteraceae bacterium]|jgi:ubiquinone/menaquinone biosynthesis C-methylase UbiE|nr:class I SAM-dependent methyltransferase [Ktedonobacteraceae bacterium]
MNNNVSIWSENAAGYDAYRPQAPTVLPDILTQLIQEPNPSLVVDIGCGTGLSTFLWAERAQQVIGIEPNENMRRQAEARSIDLDTKNVQFYAGLSTRTGLPDDCASIVTCSQSLHWMEPEPTFAEIKRILRPGGLFAAYDYDWPPTIHWEVEAAYNALVERVDKIIDELGGEEGVQRWSKKQHLERIRASGQFRYVKELLVHNSEMGDAERFIGMVSSNRVGRVLKQAVSRENLGFDRFKATIRRVLSDEPVPWYFSYHVRLGIK